MLHSAYHVIVIKAESTRLTKKKSGQSETDTSSRNIAPVISELHHEGGWSPQCGLHQEEAASPVGSDKVAEEEGEDLDDEEYDEEEEEDDDDRPRKKPKHGGFILDEAGTSSLVLLH